MLPVSVINPKFVQWGLSITTNFRSGHWLNRTRYEADDLNFNRSPPPREMRFKWVLAVFNIS